MRCCAASRGRPSREPDDFSDARGSVLVIGFGRFGQIVSQCLLARRHRRHHHRQRSRDDAERRPLRLQGLLRRRHAARRAARGGRRRRAAGRGVHRRPARPRAASSTSFRPNFPARKLYVRSFDRRHTLQLIAKGVDFELRETYESALRVRAQDAGSARPRSRARRRRRGIRAQPRSRAPRAAAGRGHLGRARPVAHAHGARAVEPPDARGHAAQSGGAGDHRARAPAVRSCAGTKSINTRIP